MSNRVWVVFKGVYDNYDLVGVFSTYKKAVEYLNEKNIDSIVETHPTAQTVSDDGCWLAGEKWDYYQTREVMVDELAPLEWCAFPNPHIGDYQSDASSSTLIGTSKAKDRALLIAAKYEAEGKK